MKSILITDIAAHLGKEITLRGWVRTIRHSGKLLFIVLRDGTGEVQCVAFQPELGEEMFETARRLTLESSVSISGTAKPHQKKEGQFELAISSVSPIQVA
ncbi:MAG TPA: OB-fold nucleic acid binding domain-containing protein, partial [Candidatus Syntrophosphaera sp.]|nr:OB-fold nucleic acid binding domain-containing protein [Candidatus Syntrophosphaera sp.]